MRLSKRGGSQRVKGVYINGDTGTFIYCVSKWK